MRLPDDYVAPASLLAMFVLVTGLPLAALGWLGHRVIEQDRALETQRQAERLENTANLLADRLTEATADTQSDLPPGTASLVFDARGVIRRDGVALPYYPAVIATVEAPADFFAQAEAIEISSPALAVERYRALARSDERAVRAGALMRMARTLRRLGNTKAALASYAELAALGGTPVAGAPAELVGRRQRAVILEATGDAPGAAAERKALAMALSEGLYAVDRTTFRFYSEAVPAIQDGHGALTNAVEEWWSRWHSEPSGRAAWTSNGLAFATAWTPVRDGTLAVIGYSAATAVSGQDAASRRSLLIAGFALMALVILAAGYFVFRALHRELTLARRQSDFVAQVSHEFRTPLTAMRHLTELLEENAASPSQLSDFHQALGKETRRLHAMVESLLDFGRIESGRQVYRLEDTSLGEVAQRAVSAFASSRLHLVVPDDAPFSRIDRDALTLAVQNLVDNAMKYSPDTSPVRVLVESRNGRGSISVEDHGAGMSPIEQRDVRRKFVRGSAAAALNVKGTGIGLAMVEQVAKAHGGRLEVNSEVGRGSRFTIWVPLSEHT